MSRESIECLTSDIDFVVTWVDGFDPEWRTRRAAYAGENRVDEPQDFHFRDWGLLRYWFRAVEKNAPWVRKVHLITCGQVPEWLDVDNPKLNLVNHEDYIPEEYLPTFSSRPIELNLHRIEGLSERFVYFNDDMFVAAKAQPEDFFSNGMPVDLAALNVYCYDEADSAELCVVRDVGIINKHFTFRDALAAHRAKWLTARAGKYLPRTMVLLACPKFPGFVIHHCALPLLKNTLEELWMQEPDLLHETCSHRFRSITDVNIWLAKEWQLAQGAFVPARSSDYHSFYVKDVETAHAVARVARERKIKHLCVNDSMYLSDEDFALVSSLVRDAFDEAYGEPSSFERSS